MKRKPAGKVTEQPKMLPRDHDDEQELPRKVKGKKKRVVGKYKPSRHSR